MTPAELTGISDYKHTHLNLYTCLLPGGRCQLLLGAYPTGGEFQWQCRWGIWPCLISDWLAGVKTDTTYHSAGHAATDVSVICLGNHYIQFKLSHKPGVAGLNCGVLPCNKRLYLLCMHNCFISPQCDILLHSQCQ